jgi:hypothetical protein
MSNQPRKSSPLGDLQVKETKDENGNFVPDLFEVRDRNGNPTGEYLQKYSIRTYIADDVDECGIGEPSIMLKRDQFIDARALSQEEIARLPDFLKNPDGSSKVQVKLSVQVNGRKSYPKKQK